MLSLREELKLLLRLKDKSNSPVRNEWTVSETTGMNLDDGLSGWGFAFVAFMLANDVKDKDVVKCFDTERYIIDNIFKYVDEVNSPDITSPDYTDFFITFTLQHIPDSLESESDGDVTEVQEKTDYTKVKLIRYSDGSKIYTYYTYSNDYYGEDEYIDSDTY